MSKIRTLSEYELRQAKADELAGLLRRRYQLSQDVSLPAEVRRQHFAKYEEGMSAWEAEAPNLWAYRQENPYSSFRPWDKSAKLWDGQQWRECYNPSQDKIFNAWKSGERFIIASGGTRSGKTFGVGARITIADLLSQPGRTVCIVGESFAQLRDDVQQALWMMRPASELAKGQRVWTPDKGFGLEAPTFTLQKQDWHFRQTSRAIFRSYDQGVDKIQGLTLHGLWFNEPPSSEEWILEALNRIATTGGWIIVTATFKYTGGVWERLTSPDFGFKIFYLRQIDNPAVPKEEVERKRKIMTPEEFAAYCEGRPMNLGGHCYTQFRRDWPWVVSRGEAPRAEELAYTELIDWHDSKPVAWQRWGVDERGEGWCVGELWHGGLITDLARKIWEKRLGREVGDEEWEKLQDRGFRPLASERWRMPTNVIFDSPSKAQVHRVGETDREQLQRMLGCGEFLTADRVQHVNRVKLVNEELVGSWNHRLDEMPKPAGTMSDPRPQIHFVKEDCPMTIDQMSSVGWEIYQTQQARQAKGIVKERKQQRDEDFTDLVDYFVTMKCRPHVSVQEGRRRDAERMAERRERALRVGRDVQWRPGRSGRSDGPSPNRGPVSREIAL